MLDGTFHGRLAIEDTPSMIPSLEPSLAPSLQPSASNEPSPSPSASQSPSSIPPMDGKDVVNAFVGFLAFLIISFLLLFAIVFIVKLALSIYRRCFGLPLSNGNAFLDGNNLNRNNYDQGSLAQNAGLSPNLLLTEREEILQTFFLKRLQSYPSLSQQAQPTNESMPQPKQQDDDIEKQQIDSTNENTEKIAVTLPEQALPQQEDDNNMCSICLTEYTNEDDSDQLLVSGTNCNHVFHYTCCMQWLKQHDECPYCRKQMLSPEEFRQAAEETLEYDRIQELKARHGTP